MHDVKHSPAPWRAVDDRLGPFYDIEDANGTVIARVCQIGVEPGERVPNAKAMAAAAELLAEVELFAEIASIESPRTQLGGWDWKGMQGRLAALLVKAKD